MLWHAHLGFRLMVYTVPGLLLALLGLIILWIIVSIPVWLAGKAVTAGKASFGDALLATLAGPIVYFIVTFLVDFLLGAVIGSTAFIFGYILALIAWIWVFKASFQTGWLQAIGIAILAWVIFVILNIIVGALFGVAYPSPFFPQIWEKKGPRYGSLFHTFTKKKGDRETRKKKHAAVCWANSETSLIRLSQLSPPIEFLVTFNVTWDLSTTAKTSCHCEWRLARLELCKVWVTVKLRIVLVLISGDPSQSSLVKSMMWTWLTVGYSCFISDNKVSLFR